MHDVDYDQRSALHLAVCECREEAVKYLLNNHFCNKDATDRWNRTALADAEWHSNERGENYDSVKLLLNNYKNGTRKKNKSENFRGKSAAEIIHAAKTGDINTLRRLRKEGVDMDLSNSAGRTALHAAAQNGIEKVVKFLIDECAVSPFVRWVQKRPIDYIPNNGNAVNNGIRTKLGKYMEDLLNAELIPEEKPDKQTQIVRLLNCASRGNIKRMRAFKEADYDMTLCDYDYRTALHIAVSDNQEHIVDFLLGECKLHMDAQTKVDRWNDTPLTIAREPGNEDIYKVFLKHCPQLVDTENDEYRTYELLTAGAKGDIKLLERLYKKNVNMNLRDYDGRTALHLAAAENRSEAVKFLLSEAKVESSIPDRENRRPYDETTNDDIKNLLKNNTENINTVYKEPSNSRETVFKVIDAASIGQLHKLQDRFLYFSMDSCDYLKNTPLHVAAAKAKLKDVQYLLEEKKVSPFVRNSFWKTPMQLVEEKIEYWKTKEAMDKKFEVQKRSSRNTSRQQDFQEVKKVLETAIFESQQETVEADDNFGKHVSDEAKIFMFLNKAYRGDLKAIKRFLVTDKTLLEKCNYDKRTALHLAVAEGHKELVTFIMKKLDDDKINKTDRWGITPEHEALRNGREDMINLFKKTEKQSELTLSSSNIHSLPNNENIINDVPFST
ncbi:60kDa lysophospholipase [Mytilus galloprovincialis]|uniref:60kDa lysophospholipase n=1 Tax=Mytilus galloprovincialis TaxID=29158 RepID=A0A8B6E8Y6_MYTGA|nr:60kDa lysophospholipase [Mytilus galloprovincialis]